MVAIGKFYLESIYILIPDLGRGNIFKKVPHGSSGEFLMGNFQVILEEMSVKLFVKSSSCDITQFLRPVLNGECLHGKCICDIPEETYQQRLEFFTARDIM